RTVGRDRDPLDARAAAARRHRADVAHVSVVDAVDRLRAEVALAPGPHLGRGAQRDHRVVQERLQCDRIRSRGHSLTAPSLTFMMRRWKMKNITATGMVMITAAASLSGYCDPWLNCPDASDATPLVSVVS